MQKPSRLVIVALVLSLGHCAPANAAFCWQNLIGGFFNPSPPSYLPNNKAGTIGLRPSPLGWFGQGVTEWGETEIMINENYFVINIRYVIGDLRFSPAVQYELEAISPELLYKELDHPGHYSLILRRGNLTDQQYQDKVRSLSDYYLIDIPRAARIRI